MFSVVILTFQEVDRVARCVESVRDAPEVWVIDAGSADGTVGCAAALGARVHVAPWQGFVAQRQLGFSLASYDWVLFLDADEVLAPGGVAVIQGWLSGGPSQGAARVTRENRWLGRTIRHGRFGVERLARLGHRQRAAWRGPEPHELLVSLGAGSVTLPVRIVHEPYRSFEDQLAKTERYARAAAQQGPRWGGPRLRGAMRFVDAAIIRSGWRDGWPGLLVAAVSAYGVVLREREARR